MKKISLKIILPVVIILPPIIYVLLTVAIPSFCESDSFYGGCHMGKSALMLLYFLGLGLDLALFITSIYFFKKKVKLAAIIILFGAIIFSLFYVMPPFAPVYNYIKGPEIEVDAPYGAPIIVNDKFKSLVSRNRSVSVSKCRGIDKESFFYTIESKNNITGSIEYFFYDGDVSLISRPVCSESKPLYHTIEREGITAMEQDFYDLFNIYD